MKFKRFTKNIPALSKDSPRNAGYDLFVRLDKPVRIYPREEIRLSLNVATEIPENVVGLLFQRSSTYRKWGLMLTNSVGVIDSLYCGDGDEWQAEFINMTEEIVTIKNGDKICQAVFFKLADIEPLEEVETLGNVDRGGFGTSYDNSEEVLG